MKRALRLAPLIFIMAFSPLGAVLAGPNDAVVESKLYLLVRVFEEVNQRNKVHEGDLLALRGYLKNCDSCSSAEVDALRKTVRAAESWNLPSTSRVQIILEQIWTPVASSLLRLDTNWDLKRRTIAKALVIAKAHPVDQKTDLSSYLTREISSQVDTLKREKPRKIESYLYEAELIEMAKKNSDDAEIPILTAYVNCLKQDRTYKPCREAYEKWAASYRAPVCRKPFKVNSSFAMYGGSDNKTSKFTLKRKDTAGHTYYISGSELAGASDVKSATFNVTDYNSVVFFVDWKPASRSKIKTGLSSLSPRFLFFFSGGNLTLVARTSNQADPHRAVQIEFPRLTADVMAKSRAVCELVSRKLPKKLVVR